MIQTGTNTAHRHQAGSPSTISSLHDNLPGAPVIIEDHLELFACKRLVRSDPGISVLRHLRAVAEERNAVNPTNVGTIDEVTLCSSITQPAVPPPRILDYSSWLRGSVCAPSRSARPELRVCALRHEPRYHGPVRTISRSRREAPLTTYDGDCCPYRSRTRSTTATAGPRTRTPSSRLWPLSSAAVTFALPM